MVASTITIDLGPVDGDEQQAWLRGLDARALSLPRGWGLMLCVALLALLGPAVPLPELAQEITRFPLRNGAFDLHSGMLFVLESDRTPTPVEAFDTRDGRSRWTYLPDGVQTLAHVAIAGDLAVLSPDLCRSGVTGTSTAVELSTGRERWRAAGVPVPTGPQVPGTVIMRSLWSDGCGAVAGNNATDGALRWQGIDGDGTIRWEVSVEAGVRVAVDASSRGAGWAVVLDRQDRLSVVDFATGQRSPAVTGIASAADYRVAALDDLLLVVGWDLARGGSTISAYDRRTLIRRWRTYVPVGPFDHFSIGSCGSAVCLNGSVTSAVDRATGQPLWTADRSSLTEVPGGLLDGTSGNLLLRDPAGGARLAELPGWRLLGVDQARQRLLLGVLTGDRTALAWSTGPGVVQPFGTLDGTLVECAIEAARAACRTDGDEVRLLKLR